MMLNNIIAGICVLIIMSLICYWALRKNKEFYKEI